MIWSSRIDPANRPSSFQHSNVFETGISTVHLRIAEQFKMDFQKKLPKVKAYCNYKKKKKQKQKKKQKKKKQKRQQQNYKQQQQQQKVRSDST